MCTNGVNCNGIFGGPSAWSGFVLPVESQDSMSIVNAAMGAARKTLEPCGEAAGYEVFSEDTSGWTRSTWTVRSGLLPYVHACLGNYWYMSAKESCLYDITSFSVRHADMLHKKLGTKFTMNDVSLIAPSSAI
ncbi:uncharacterized protein LOC125508372 [Triticum urartu]|uniref:uncharacterized protein LOC125508372 n=1 Tax=Triticum urartu TaxID=4572 RepID=UPI000E7CB20F|nr:uncharacterized protein LOC125508372 [Triticum urartu]